MQYKTVCSVSPHSLPPSPLSLSLSVCCELSCCLWVVYLGKLRWTDQDEIFSVDNVRDKDDVITFRAPQYTGGSCVKLYAELANLAQEPIKGTEEIVRSHPHTIKVAELRGQFSETPMDIQVWNFTGIPSMRSGRF